MRTYHPESGNKSKVSPGRLREISSVIYHSRRHEFVIVGITYTSGPWSTKRTSTATTSARDTSNPSAERVDRVEPSSRRSPHRRQKSIASPWASTLYASRISATKDRMIGAHEHPATSLWSPREKWGWCKWVDAREWIEITSADGERVLRRDMRP